MGINGLRQSLESTDVAHGSREDYVTFIGTRIFVSSVMSSSASQKAENVGKTIWMKYGKILSEESARRCTLST